MTIKEFISILQKRNRDLCYNDFMYCLINNMDFYVDDYVVAEKTCFIFLTDEFKYVTPKYMVAELKKYSYRKNWKVAFVYDDCIFEYYTSYKMYNNLILELR